MATKLPQSPLTKLEEIICDADLDYLGRDDFFPIADKLYREMKVAGLLQDKKQWNLIQLAFLQEHRYFTDSSIQLRNEKKLEHLEAIRKIVDDDGTLSS